MKLYEKDLPGEFNLKDNFSNSAYREFLDTLKNDYPELVPYFKDEDNYGYGSWFYEKAFDFYKEIKGEIDWENMDKFVTDFLETEGKSIIKNLNNLKKRDDNQREAIKTGKVNGKKVWHWDYEDDPDDGTRRQFKSDGINPVDGTYDGVYESIQILEQQGYRVVLNESTQIDESVKDDIVNKIYELAEEFGHGVNKQYNGYLIYNQNMAVEDDEEFIDKLEKELGSTIGYDDDGDGNLFVWLKDIVESTINETVDIADEVRELLENDGYDEDEIEELMDYTAIDDMASVGGDARYIADQLIDNVYGNLKFESKMNEAINNPDEPASKKQLWALFCITRQDWRDKNLTKGEASELIQKYSGERTTKNKESLSTNSIKKDIIQNLKPKLDKQMEKAFGMQSVVGDADLEGNLIPGRKRYKFFGSGCGWAWVKYDKRNKKLGEVLDKYDDIYRNEFFEKFAKEYIKKYKERELGAVLSQDIDIQCIIKQAALNYAESIGINTKGAYVNSRLD